ncbi:MAG: restriction endonuclease subunit S [Haliscomenobacter sp.]|nr:restriction endonuclease subunit S [Haliscomenobacter sp.]
MKKLSLKQEFFHVPLSYVRYFLQSHYQQLNTYSRGSVIQHVDPALFRKLEIPIPAKNDERFQRICTLLQAIDEIEQHTARQLHLVRDLKQSFLHEAFTPGSRNDGPSLGAHP